MVVDGEALREFMFSCTSGLCIPSRNFQDHNEPKRIRMKRLRYKPHTECRLLAGATESHIYDESKVMIGCEGG